ncbi:MAG TPA: hypothetical protein VNL35_17175 [Chloroflexota bacterium]|nr:hypothetical protein [Chloroflexota bacterium]
MSIKSFALFWYDFVIGDDWRIAGAVVAALIVTALLVHGHVAAWWLLPLVVASFLGLSMWQVARK